MNEYKTLLKHKMLSSIYDKMDERERLAFILAYMQNSNHRETMSALGDLQKQVQASRRSWLSDFGANVAGNAAFGGALILLRLLKGFI